MGVHSERGLQIGMSQECLGRFQRLAGFVQQRGVSVAKEMPGNTWQFYSITSASQLPVVQVCV
jgi:hypothetical protein